MARQKEMAVRLALGATRMQLMRQLLLESVMLSIGGGDVRNSAFGVGDFGSLVLPPARAYASRPQRHRRLARARVHICVERLGRVAFGFAPAWAASRSTVSNALKGEDALARPGRPVNLRSIACCCPGRDFGCADVRHRPVSAQPSECVDRIDVGFGCRKYADAVRRSRVHGYTPERTVQFLDSTSPARRSIAGSHLRRCH